MGECRPRQYSRYRPDVHFLLRPLFDVGKVYKSGTSSVESELKSDGLPNVVKGN